MICPVSVLETYSEKRSSPVAIRRLKSCRLSAMLIELNGSFPREQPKGIQSQQNDQVGGARGTPRNSRIDHASAETWNTAALPQIPCSSRHRWNTPSNAFALTHHDWRWVLQRHTNSWPREFYLIRRTSNRVFLQNEACWIKLLQFDRNSPFWESVDNKIRWDLCEFCFLEVNRIIIQVGSQKSVDVKREWEE